MQCLSALNLRITSKINVIVVRNMSLLKHQALLNGNWCTAASEKVFNILNPANGEVVGSVPDMDVIDTERAIDAAKTAFASWKKTTGKERSNILRKWYNLVSENQENIAQILTAEAGKSMIESRGEVMYGNSFIEYYSEEARRISGEVIESSAPTKKIIVERHPIGVVGIITPWNFPFAMITRKVSAALAAGCTCVIKPAEDTPLTALALAQLACEAGVPNGVINVITCTREKAPQVGNLLCTSPDVAGISFTGSTNIGKLLYRQCADGVKRIGLELGGNAPFIVFESANLDVAAASALSAKFRNCGQACVAANRFLIQESVFDEFLAKFKENVEKNIKIGLGCDMQSTTGPIINSTQFKQVVAFVEDAVCKGAKVELGGKPATHIGDLFYEPTILTNITKDMLVYSNEIFGPVAPLIPFKTEEEAIKIANSTHSGLAGYFFSENVSQIFRVGKALEMGMIGINEGIVSSAESPFGGIKESGIGREGSKHGIDEYVYIKMLCVGNLQM